MIDFAEFYRACYSRDPFPWQTRLAKRVIEEGWPSEIGVPTGLGKTSCLHVGVWALAAQSSLAPADRTMPTRIWYVVNRRLLVDAALEEMLHLQTQLRQGLVDGDERLAVVAQGLIDIGGLQSDSYGPLHVSQMRGGVGRLSTVPDPSQPAVILSTVPMFASRWLFRGYGSSRSRRPIDAALAGIDSLVLLDEAHLSEELSALVRPLRQCDAGDSAVVVPQERSQVGFVHMTATGAATADRFDLDADDLEHAVVQRRLNASKTLSARKAKKGGLVKALVAATSDLVAGGGLSCVVFVNSPKTAREVKALLDEKFDDVALLSGVMRPFESNGVRDRLLGEHEGLRSGLPRVSRDAPLIVVATQTLEVGADLDFDLLVTESAGVRALTQRFGRLNRLGNLESAKAIMCHEEGSRSYLYGDEPAEVAARLGDVEHSISPADVRNVLGEAALQSLDVPELLPAHLWEWVKTTLAPVGEAPPHLFFEGFSEARVEASVAWRSFPIASEERLFPPLGRDELVDVSLKELRDFVGDHDVWRRDADGVGVTMIPGRAIKPGDEIILPTSIGGYGRYCWDPTSIEEVVDVSAFASGVLVLDESVLSNLLNEPSGELLKTLNDLRDDSVAVDVFIEQLRLAVPKPAVRGRWESFVASLGRRVVRPVDLPPYLSVVESSAKRVEVAYDAIDGLSFAANSQLLTEHMGAVGELAAKIARAIGCPEELAVACDIAGRWHDIGKADPRFQRWLGAAPSTAELGLLAKSKQSKSESMKARKQAGWPAGGRHELISGLLLEAAIANGWHPGAGVDIELVRHLVISHHGHGRPSVDVVDDPYPVVLSTAVDNIAVEVTSDLSKQDWDQPARFRELCERYGYWGLALLETVVRLSDWAASSAVAGRDQEVV